MPASIVETPYFIRYCLDGVLHRADGPAVEWNNGITEWYINGLRHRTTGPAIESPNGSQYWYNHGIRHRLDGPAIEYSDGIKEWFINGANLTEKINQWFEKMDFNSDYTIWTQEQKLQFKLRWC